MQLTHDDRDTLTVLTLKGELSSDHTDRFRRAALERLEQKVRDFVLDLSKTDFVDSKGFETLLWLQQEAGERLGQIRLAGCQEHVLKAIEITRLSNRLACYGDVASAVSSLR